MPALLQLFTGDITTLDVDAIVNAANAALSGGGGVDGAIHRAAGPGLLDACRKLGRCAVGDAVLTPGFQLRARFVVHAVGPVWRGGGSEEEAQLASCYRRSLELAAGVGAASIAFPCISTGAYRFPPREAARIALATTRTEAPRQAAPRRIVFCCFDESDARLYRARAGELGIELAEVTEPTVSRPR
jgi:O-acetyl-ADP-ribose deacetylase (regulator of RNase III)